VRQRWQLAERKLTNWNSCCRKSETQSSTNVSVQCTSLLEINRKQNSRTNRLIAPLQVGSRVIQEAKLLLG